MNPLEKKWKWRRFVLFCAEIVADITTSQLRTWKHIFWQHEQHEPHTIIHKYLRIMLSIYSNTVNIKIHFCMKINSNCMPIFNRTPNCTFVNVGQSMSTFYRESFQKGQLDYMYERIARATLHLKGQDSRWYPSLASWLPREKL